jgi:hypothetical protein
MLTFIDLNKKEFYMKNNFTKSVLLVGILCAALSPLKAQNQQFDEIIRSGVQDANTYFSNYMSPFAASLGNGMAGGWYNTARPHKTLGFDLTASLSYAIIPPSANTFTFNQQDYNNLQLVGSSTNELPTFVGSDYTGGGRLEVSGSREIAPGVNVEGNQSFDVLNGLGIGDYVPGPLAVPVPSFQLGVGIIKNTDLIIRLTPEINLDDVSFRQFGIGIKHDIKQWIPGMKLLPFDLSALVAFNTINSTYQIDEQAGQYAEFNANATTFQVLVSKKLFFFTPYAGLGINAINTTFKVLGDFEFDDGLGGNVTVTDPVALDFTGNGGARFTIGARFKILWVLAAHVDYTFQTYNTLNVGFGINIR